MQAKTIILLQNKRALGFKYNNIEYATTKTIAN